MSVYPSRRYYERVASASGYPPGPLETVFRLADLLARIETALPGEFLLRGGTALNLLHLDAPRLSVDLDLDYVGESDGRLAQERRPDLLAEIEELAVTAGYEVSSPRPSYAMAHLLLRYVDAAGRSAALKLDIDFLDRVPVLDPVRLPLRHPFGEDVEVSLVQTLALDELAASKVIALARRGLPRDLFDVAEIGALGTVDLGTLRTALVARGAGYSPPSPDDYATDGGESVRLVDWRSQVVALALRDRTVDLAVAKSRARHLLGQLLQFSSGQRAFLRAIEVGTLDVGLLGNPAVAERIAKNPALLWRLQNGSAGLEER